MFFFNNYPKINYDLLKNNRPSAIQNPLVRFKLKDILKSKTALYYTHDVQDGQSAQFIAHRYYGDDTLDWVIYVTNDIIDPQYGWPLNYQDFINFLKAKYGSVATAQSTNHHYEQIIQTQSVLYDGTIIPEKSIEVDYDTYVTLTNSERRSIDCYTYEEKQNEKKRTIKILHKNYLTQFLNEAESIFQ